MKLDSFDRLYLMELRDLYSAENQLTRALPKMAKAAASPKLSEAFQMHLEETRTHVDRLEKIFGDLGVSPKGHKCAAMQGLISEGQEILDADADPEVRDAALIGAAQRIEHYEMAGYGCARTYAHMLGRHADKELLQSTLDEEGKADKKLNKIAMTVINPAAATDRRAPARGDERPVRGRAAGRDAGERTVREVTVVRTPRDEVAPVDRGING